MQNPNIHLYLNDLPDDFEPGEVVAIDTETLGLNLHRDRLCVAQISKGDGHCYLVQFSQGSDYAAPNLKAILTNPKIQKIFHFARFDVAAFYQYLGVETENIYCTKIASRLTRTYADRHGLKDLCKSILGIEISKQEQTSDWGSPELSPSQMEYAATDVLYLHKLRQKLEALLIRENRKSEADKCFDFIMTRAKLDLMGWNDQDIFAHI
ncbi:Ribonuclease D [Candidatus Bealeia paramacronuclearis]|uniref:Ribonuclease D n=1 Tax=Candidatus Bealeia paramacronuclearis TaxID=1921001 RepID=A0ABZ2C5Y8_9PROT|nr:Ribonuclease D [Candidatus Bealeia paramacronuclearis]